MSLGKKGLEGKGRFSRAGNTGDDDKAVAGDIHIYPFQVVNPGPFDPYVLVLAHWLVLVLRFLSPKIIIFGHTPSAGPCPAHEIG